MKLLARHVCEATIDFDDCGVDGDNGMNCGVDGDDGVDCGVDGVDGDDVVDREVVEVGEFGEFGVVGVVGGTGGRGTVNMSTIFKYSFPLIPPPKNILFVEDVAASPSRA
jgi:hypothetical protein